MERSYKPDVSGVNHADMLLDVVTVIGISTDIGDYLDQSLRVYPAAYNPSLAHLHDRLVMCVDAAYYLEHSGGVRAKQNMQRERTVSLLSAMRATVYDDFIMPEKAFLIGERIMEARGAMDNNPRPRRKERKGLFDQAEYWKSVVQEHGTATSPAYERAEQLAYGIGTPILSKLFTNTLSLAKIIR